MTIRFLRSLIAGTQVALMSLVLMATGVYAQVTDPECEVGVSLSGSDVLAWGEIGSLTVDIDDNGNCSEPGTLSVTGPGVDVSSPGTISLPMFTSAGQHIYDASYSRDGASSSDSHMVTVEKADTVTTMQVSPGGTQPYGTLRQFSFQTERLNDPVGGEIEGEWELFINGFPTEQTSTTNNDSVETTMLPVGSYDLTVRFNGGPNDQASESAPVSITVTKSPVNIEASVSPQVAVPGDTVRLVARAVGSSSYDFMLPVQFFIGTESVGSAYFSTDGVAELMITLPAGATQMRAYYPGDDRYLSGEDTAPITVAEDAISTSTNIEADAYQVPAGGSVGLTVSVMSDSGTELVSGSVTIEDNGVFLASIPLNDGQASYTATNIAEGEHSYLAIFEGNSQFGGSISPIPALVQAGLAQTMVNLTPLSQTVGTGQPVSVTAHVSLLTGSGAISEGTVEFFLDGNSVGSTSVSNGEALMNFSGMDIGSYEVTASYSGSAVYQASSSSQPAVIEVNEVVKANPEIALSITPANPTATDAIDIVVDVSGDAGLATGDVTLRIDGDVYEGRTLSSGQASFLVPSLTAGEHTISVTYDGDDVYWPATETRSLTIASDTANLLLSYTPNPASMGDNVVVTATVLGSGIAPEGSVEFFVNGSGSGSYLLVDGKAELMLSGISAGDHVVEAHYSGDENYSSSTGNVTISVGKIDPVLSATVSSDSFYEGSSEMLWIEVSGEFGAATGSVSISGGGISEILTLETGQASLDLSTLDDGDYTLSVAYPGDDIYEDASSSVSFTILSYEVSIDLTQDEENSTPGQSVTFTATLTPVAPAVSPAEGTVTFLVDGTPYAQPISAGRAQLTIDTLSVGEHSIMARFEGDDRYDSVVSEVIVHTVSKIDTQTALTITPTPSQIGETFTLTAQVSSGSGIPTGSVSFERNGVQIGISDLNGVGVATFETSEPKSGTYSFTARYQGSSLYANSFSSAITHTVGAASAQISLNVPNEPLWAGERQIVTAIVEATGTVTGTPTGFVTFTIDGQTSDPLELVDGQVSFETQILDAGVIEFYASYGGSEDYTSASTSETRTVSLNSTNTSISASPNPALFGDEVTVLATVDSPRGTPTGSISLRIDGVEVSVPTLSDGTASYSFVPSMAGNSYQISAIYPGEADLYAPSQGSVTLVVQDEPEPEAVSVIINGDSSVDAGSTPSYEVAVTPQSGGVTPTGDVRFDLNGTTLDIVALADGRAMVTTSSLPAGTHELVATYLGDSIYGSASSSVFTITAEEVVTEIETTTSLTASPSPSQVNQDVTLSATVSAANAQPVTSGLVEFLVDGSIVDVSVVSAGQASTTWTGIVAGDVSFVARYLGSGVLQPSQSSEIVHSVEEPAPASTTTTITGPTSVVVGEAVTLSISVTSPSAVPVGVVDVLIDDNVVGSVTLDAGLASWDWTPTEEGVFSVSAQYQGATGYEASTSSVLQITVEAVEVEREATTITISAPETAEVGTPFFVDVSVSSDSGTPQGEVTLRGNGSVIGTMTLSGSATTRFEVTASEAGLLDLVASYAGSATHAASGSLPVSVMIEDEDIPSLVSTTTTLTAPTPVELGNAVPFAVSVEAETGTPEGVIELRVDGDLVGSTTLSDGYASVSWTPSASGSFDAVARYLGSTTYGTSVSGVFTIVVEEAEEPSPEHTQTSLSLSAVSVDVDQEVILTATTTAAEGTPYGAVMFEGNGNLIGAVSLSGGVAELAFTPEAAGTYEIIARYEGNSDFMPSASPALDLVVNALTNPEPVATSVEIDIIDHMIEAGETAIADITVVPQASSLVDLYGEVIIIVDGSDVATLSLVNGSARWTGSGLSEGSYEIAARYVGNSDFLTSLSSAQTLTVTPPAPRPSQVSVASSVSPAAIGQTVSFDISVTSDTGLMPQGSVTIIVDGNTLATQTLNNGVATWSTTFDSAGDKNVGVSYSGDSRHLPSTSSILVQSVYDPEELGSITIRQLVNGEDASFAFASDAPDVSGTLATRNGSGERGPVPVFPGTYTVLARDAAEAGYVLTRVWCSDSDSTGDASARKATIIVGPGEDVICTFSSVDARSETTEQIQNFLDIRGDILVSNLPGMSRRIDRLNGRLMNFDFGSMVFGYMPMLEGAPMQFSGSLAGIESAMGYRKGSRFDVWFEFSGGTLEYAGDQGVYGIASAGADYRLTDDILVGGLVMGDRISLDGDGDRSVSGLGAMAGPYLTMRMADGLYLDLMALVGGSRNSISPYGSYSDDFSSLRYILNGAVQGDWSVGALTFSPRAEVTYLSETSEAYTDSNGIDIPSLTEVTGTVAAGPGVSYDFNLNGLDITASARADAVMDFSGDKDVRARLETGLDIGLPGGGRVDLGISHEGMGTGNTILGIRGGLNVPIQ